MARIVPHQTVGQRIARARRQAGLSQARLAAEADCSESLISKVERGVLGLDSLKLARRIARVLDIELVDLLGFATRPQKGVTSGEPCFDLLNGCDRLGPDSAVEEGGGVKRRETLKAGAALGGGLVVSATLDLLGPDDGDRLLAALNDPARHLTEKVVRVLEQTGTRYQRRKGTLPTRQMLPLASEHLTAVRRLRPAARTGEQQRRLAVVEAQAGRLVGKLAVHNLGDQRSARTAYGIALAAAHDAGPDSVTLRAYVLGGMAFMESQVGDPKTAAATMTQALEVGRASTLAPLRCWLASTAATVHARVGDRRACDQALRASDDLFALPSPNDPAWTGSIDRAFLLGDKAACLLRLNQPQPALETLAQAERLVPQKRLQRRTVLLGHRADALLRDGQVLDGCQAAVDALELAILIGYRRVIDQVRTLRLVRVHRQRTSPAVRELDELLRLAAVPVAHP